MEGLGEGLGELGFWLAAGIVVAAMIVSGGRKEREKEREKQATLRALLEGAGENTTEVLAYLREKDAAELKVMRQALGLDWGKGIGAAGVIGFIVIVLAIGAGLVSLIYTSPRREFVRAPADLTGAGPQIPPMDLVTTSPLGDFALAPVGVMMAIWAAGFVIAALIWLVFGKKRNDARPGA
jgi:hypothetical protein